MAATVEESTPPDIATAIVFFDMKFSELLLLLLHRTPTKLLSVTVVEGHGFMPPRAPKLIANG
jgi:hypothetical protein